MKKLALCLFGAILAGNAMAAGCDWATDTPADDGKYKYFVAKSYSESSASDAAKKAEQDIDAQLGRLFGTKLDVQSEFYADESGASGTTRAYERAIGVITLKGLERQKSDVEKGASGWTGCVQYRYLKSEITAEQNRLKKLSPSELKQSLIFTEVVGDTQCKGAPVEIVTTPSGAYVTLDDGKYQGTAPIKFGNVCNGKHTLEITKDNYVAISEKLIVPTSGRINKTLKRDSKRITVSTSLKNSQIEINGVNKGKEPVSFNAPLGIEQTITATNKEAVKITRSRTFSKDSDSEYVISMEKLPGKIDFTAFKVRNPGVIISVDGKTISGNTTKELNPDKKHDLTFAKKGYYDINKSLSIVGGDTTYYPSQELRFSKEPEYTIGGIIGIGASAGSGVGGGNIDLGGYYKTEYLYASAGGQLNLMDLSDAKMTYNYNINNRINQHTANISMYYFELLYLHLGFNIGRKLSVFGIGTVGALNIDSQESTTTSSLNISDKYKTVFRYGIGVQYNLYKFENNDVGLRLSYLTGNSHLSPSDIAFTHISNYDHTNIEISDQVFNSYPKQINTFNLTVFVTIPK